MTASGNAAYAAYIDELRTMQTSADVSALIRFTGEALARFDRRWQTARMAGQPVEPEVDAMLCAAMHHAGLLADAGRDADAVGALLMSLLAVDVSGADIKIAASSLLSATHTFAIAVIGIADRLAGDSFAAQHADVCARYALELFRRVAAAHPAPLPAPAAELMAVTGNLALPPLNDEPASSASSGELICDILSRLRACEIISL